MRIQHDIKQAGVKPRLFIASPSYSGDFNHNFVASLLKTTKDLKEHGIGYEVYFSLFDSLVGRARNDLADNFLKSDCTHILMVDADQGWDETAPRKMLSYNREFMTGAVPGRKAEETYALKIQVNRNMTPKVDSEGLLYCDTNGVAFAVIERGVFEKIKEYKKYYNQPVYPYFQHRYYENGDHYGEDAFFIKSWKDAGGDVWIYPNITFTHGPITANYHEFLLKQPKPKVIMPELTLQGV